MQGVYEDVPSGVTLLEEEEEKNKGGGLSQPSGIRSSHLEKN